MECDKKGEAPIEAYKALADDGWIGVSTPEEYGGMGGDALDLALVLETAGMHYLDLATMIFRTSATGGCLLVSGTDAQKKEFIPATVKARSISHSASPSRTQGFGRPRPSSPARIAKQTASGSRVRKTLLPACRRPRTFSSPRARTTQAPSMRASRISSSPPMPRASPGRSSNCSATGDGHLRGVL